MESIRAIVYLNPLNSTIIIENDNAIGLWDQAVETPNDPLVLCSWYYSPDARKYKFIWLSVREICDYVFGGKNEQHS